MSVLVNEGLNVEIMDLISNISTKLKTRTFLVGGYVRDLDGNKLTICKFG